MRKLLFGALAVAAAVYVEKKYNVSKTVANKVKDLLRMNSDLDVDEFEDVEPVVIETDEAADAAQENV